MYNVDFSDPKVKFILREMNVFVYSTYGKNGQHGFNILCDINKDKLLGLANIVILHFNRYNFFTKSTDRIQQINSCSLIEHNTAIYFKCHRMNNFVVYGGSKRGTFYKLLNLLFYIIVHENDHNIDLSEFIAS